MTHSLPIGAVLTLLAAFPMWLQAGDAPSERPIDEVDRSHWSFQPLTRPPVPSTEDNAWCRTPVDRFILSRLEEEGLRPMPDADRLTLLRRATVDLTGLPPTLDEINAFLADNRPGAYERLVGRLLASPAYGERWAQHWLDLARFAETDGFELDKLRPQAWRYRDWVIDALNADLDYDRFVSLQLAGDRLLPDEAAAHIATGFLLCGPDMTDINLRQERQHMVLNDMTANVAEVLLGLRMGCAQCHDHKTDPISQYDFYRMRAFFDPLDLFEDHPLPGGPAAGPEPLKARVARSSGEKRSDSFLWIRGDFRRQGPEVHAAVPRVVDASFSNDSSGLMTDNPVDRTSLAAWITSEDNPLTARVIANRLWQHHFGVGLAATSSDFGLMGDPPTHPRLLDWLASELIRHEWSLKAMHRLIVTSSVYRTASRAESSEDATWTALCEVDPDNELLGRMRRRRLDGESLRDAMLAVSLQLNRSQHGPGVRPPLPAEVTSTLLKNQWPVTEDISEHSRRSIYLFARRNLRYPLFDVFDKPDPNLSCPRRSESTIAPQALHLLNSEFAHQCAASLAARLTAASDDTTQQIRLLYQIAYGRPPTSSEEADAGEFLREGDRPAALNDLCLAVLNTNEFLYID